MQNNNNMYSPLNTYEFLYHISGGLSDVVYVRLKFSIVNMMGSQSNWELEI